MRHVLRSHLHLGGLPLEQGLVEQLVELMLVLGGVYHSVGQVLEAQPPARVGEGGVVSLQGSAAELGGPWGMWGKHWGQTGWGRGTLPWTDPPGSRNHFPGKVFPGRPRGSRPIGSGPRGAVLPGFPGTPVPGPVAPSSSAAVTHDWQCVGERSLAPEWPAWESDTIAGSARS